MKHNGLESGRLSSSGEALYELLDIAKRKRSGDGVSVSAEELRKAKAISYFYLREIRPKEVF